jgi:peptide/nickel transport system substrate-binding protein
MKKVTYLLVGIMVLASLLVMSCGSPATSSAPAPTSAAPKTSAPVSSAPAASTPASSVPAKPTASVPASSAPAASKYGGILNMSLTVGPSTPLGYMPEAAPDSYSYSKPALEPLVGVKLGGIVTPILATSWDVDPAAKTMVFHLRKGVKFHDGSDFNASVVKWNYELIMAAKKAPNFVSVDVVDDYTLKITVKTYQNTDLTGMFSGAFNVISKASFDKNGIEYTRSHPIGTGPFKFVEYVRDSKLSYTKNPDYWDAGKPYVDGVVYNVVAEETVRKIMFQRGDLHILTAQGITAQELQKAGTIMKTQPGGTYGLVPDSNNATSPFSKLAVRQAVSYAIDRDAFTAGLGFGFLKPAYQMYGGYAAAAIPGLQKTPFDPARARQLLKDAGYPTGFKTSIHTFTRLIPNDWVTALAKMLGDVGIQTEADFPTAGKYEEYRSQGWTNSMMAHGFINSDNFNSFFNLYFPTTNIMFPSVKKPDGFAAAVTASITSPQVDPAKLQAVFKIMNDDLMVIPYGEQVQAQFYVKGVNDPGAEEYPLTSTQYKEVWLEASARK